jgi:putative oxidoreductase
MNLVLQRIPAWLERIPNALIALAARVGIGATFWLSGQTKIEGLVLDPVGLHAEFGWPRVSEGALELFRSEYALPLIPPELAAPLAAFSEHLFPLMLLLGLGTRYAALALLAMTAVIEVFVYPDAWPTHAVWAACLLYLVARGGGSLSLDHLLARRRR